MPKRRPAVTPEPGGAPAAGQDFDRAPVWWAGSPISGLAATAPPARSGTEPVAQPRGDVWNTSKPPDESRPESARGHAGLPGARRHWAAFIWRFRGIPNI